MIQVTKPFFPPIAEYQKYVDDIWKNEWFTNNGPYVRQLEDELKKYLGVENFLFVTNGTIAIQLAIRALGLKGKIITTPFSYVATVSSVVWEHCEPVFVDIDPDTMNIDPSKIEKLITPDVTAILATHVYGNACDIDAIQAIALRHSLKVIYDGAHAFGTTYKGRSVFAYGDVTTASFHATKLYHTVEGGGVSVNDKAVCDTIGLMRNFGHNGFGVFSELGVNGKNSELHAAMGLVNLRYLKEILDTRKRLSLLYDEQLKGTILRKPLRSEGFNYAYYAVMFESEQQLLKTEKDLQDNGISPRRYFWPSLSTLPYVKPSSVPVCEDISLRILCLPMYHTLATPDVDRVCDVIRRSL